MPETAASSDTGTRGTEHPESLRNSNACVGRGKAIEPFTWIPREAPSNNQGGLPPLPRPPTLIAPTGERDRQSRLSQAARGCLQVLRTRGREHSASFHGKHGSEDRARGSRDTAHRKASCVPNKNVVRVAQIQRAFIPTPSCHPEGNRGPGRDSSTRCDGREGGWQMED